jgi:signal transduction histidine kinase
MTDRLKVRVGRLREKLWWFDIVYPITLILFMFGSLTYIIYAGQPQYRLSKIAEKRLLISSLRLSGSRPAASPGKILIVSASPFEVNRFGRAPGGSIPDVNAGAYAKVLQKLLDAGVRNVFVNWDTEAHLFDEIYMLPLTETIRHSSPESKVFFGMNPDHLDSMPADFARTATLLDSGPCDEITEVQVECVYNRKWDDWVVQSVLNVLGEDKRAESDTPSWISMELSSNSPRYILNLSPADTIESRTFSQLLATDTEKLSGYNAVFVGVDYSNVLSPSAKHSFPLMVRTIYDPEKTDTRFSGTPMHVFWAQLAQMYVDRGMVTVPSNASIWLITFAFSSMILAVMIWFGGLHALGMFIAFGALAPVVNAWSLRLLQVYVPMFDSYFFGLTILISTGMLRLSWTSWQRWQLETRRHYHSKFMDLKSNFISLFSHNLNTPVAKMQGMLGILKTSMTNMPAESRHLAQEADMYVGLLEYAIRGVLVGSALEEHSLNDTSRPLRNLYMDVLESNASSLRRLGVSIAPKLMHAPDDEAVLAPLVFDVRALSATISSLAALYRSPGEPARVTVEMQLSEDDGGGSVLAVTFRSEQSAISQQAAEILRAPEKRRTLKRLHGDKFIDEVLAGLGTLFASHYRGEISQEPVGTGGHMIRMTVRCSNAPDGKAIA